MTRNAGSFTPLYGTPFERLVANVIEVDGCWLGTDRNACRFGYQRVNFRVPGLGGRVVHFSAHVLTWIAAETGLSDLDELFLAYQELRASGLELDHTCENTACRRPKCLEPVTHTENCQRRLDRRAARADARPFVEEDDEPLPF